MMSYLADPEHPCRIMPTRSCPDSYNGVCGDRPCARFESENVLPWMPERLGSSTITLTPPPTGTVYLVASDGHAWVALPVTRELLSDRFPEVVEMLDVELDRGAHHDR